MSGYQGKVLAGKDTLSTATSPWHSVTEALMPQDDRGTGSQSAATTASTRSWGRNTSACNHEQLMKHARRGEKWSHDLRCNELPAKAGAGTGVAVSFWEHRALASQKKLGALKNGRGL